MKYLALILVSCAVAAVVAPGPARAFDIQGQNATVPDAVEPFSALFPESINSNDARGSSLALPYIGKTDSSAFYLRLRERHRNSRARRRPADPRLGLSLGRALSDLMFRAARIHARAGLRLVRPVINVSR